MADRIVILGAGESGTGAAVLASVKGFEVFVSDSNIIQPKYKEVLDHYGVRWEEGQHNQASILNAMEVIKSPGISDRVPIIEKIMQAGIPVISEIEFAGRYTTAKTICITGTNGKTTTTLLTGHILRQGGVDAGIAGNVGKSFAWQVALEPHPVYVLEISSYQLDGMFGFKADISVLLNITPDHLDRYGGSFQAYTNSKLRIVQNQTASDTCIFCDDDPVVKEAISKVKNGPTAIAFSAFKKPGLGAWLENTHTMKFNVKSEEFEIDTNELAIVGKHNIYNSMASGITARLLDLRKDLIKESLGNFENAGHRLESVCYVRGVEFINDSKATNVNAAWYALETMNKPVIWVMGGQDKGNDYSLLMPLVREKVKAMVCLGKDNRRILETFGTIGMPIIETQNVEDAVKQAYQLGSPGDVVLLSPACASFDLFDNYEDRGNQFKQAALTL